MAVNSTPTSKGRCFSDLISLLYELWIRRVCDFLLPCSQAVFRPVVAPGKSLSAYYFQRDGWDTFVSIDLPLHVPSTTLNVFFETRCLYFVRLCVCVCVCLCSWSLNCLIEFSLMLLKKTLEDAKHTVKPATLFLQVFGMLFWCLNLFNQLLDYPFRLVVLPLHVCKCQS